MNKKRRLSQSFKCGDKFVFGHQCNVRGIHMIKGLQDKKDELLELAEGENNKIIGFDRKKN